MHVARVSFRETSTTVEIENIELSAEGSWSIELGVSPKRNVDRIMERGREGLSTPC